MMAPLPTSADIRALDDADPLRGFRARFDLPEGVIYLDGNSLGPPPRAAAGRIADVVAREWGSGLIASWNDAEWIGAPARIGDKIARLIGAAEDEVIVTDSTSVNLFKLVVAAAGIAPPGAPIIAEAVDFPTDLHIARRAAELTGRPFIAVARDRLPDVLLRGIGVAALSHVHYRSGARHDLGGLTALAREHGGRIVWDLSHSIGAVPIDLARSSIDLAIGCGYKYLNGGPGAPAFLHVAKGLQSRLSSPIAGWFGHAAPFAFEDDYVPADGIARFLAGTPPMLSLLALECGVDLMLEADGAALSAKSSALFDMFADLAAAHSPSLVLVTPRDPARRGSHISFAHPHAFEIVQALIARGVIGDFRAPDIARFGLAPLYLSFVDIARAVDVIADVIDGESFRNPRFAVRGKVT